MVALNLSKSRLGIRAYWKSLVVASVAIVNLTFIANFVSAQEAKQASFQTNSNQVHLMQLLQSIDPYNPVANVKGKATLSGSTTMVLLGQSWAERFKLFHPGVEFVRGVDGTDAALDALAKDPNVIAGVSRSVTDADLQKLKSGQCKDPLTLIVALDPMAVYVHKDNPVQGITPEQLQALFADSGAAGKTWGDFGVTGDLAKKPVRVHHRSELSGTRNFIQQSILDGKKMAEAAETHKSNHDICQAIAADPAGVSMCGFGDSVDGVKTVALVLNGQIVPANEESFLAGNYPLVRPLSLVLDRSRISADGGLRESIIRYILSRDGQTEAIRAGFFPLNPQFVRQELAQLTDVHQR